MARGDVLLVELPYPRGAPGYEQTGRRPAVAVQADLPGASLPTVMIVPLTSQLTASRFPHTIAVDPSPQNGLTDPSVLLVFQLRALDQGRILRTIGHLEQNYLDQLDAEMRSMLHLQ